jgi:ABC-type dipeptide/oligopeptide/nickel transport system ATPase component
VTEDKATQPLLDVRNLKTYFYTEDGVVRAVDGVDITVDPGEVLGIVGESGCGKSVTSLSIMRLIGQPGKIIEGEIFYEGREPAETHRTRNDENAWQPDFHDLPTTANFFKSGV